VAYPLDDTIVAIASPPGGAARAIIRLSGPDAHACAARLFHPDPGSSPFTLHLSPFTVSGALHLPGLHSPLPADMYLWPNGRSYTGQPVVEFHTLGSPPLLDAVLRAACGVGARLAQPGEFTQRAFLAGRIDLAQAEAVLGVIEASDPGQLDVALGQLAGGLSRPLAELRETLLDLLCRLEAGLDFPDEDVSFITPHEIAWSLAAAHEAATALAAQLQSRHRAGHRPSAVLVGPPNVGKSSLFNALTGKGGAIVSHDPGTTRDYVSAEVDLDGVLVRLIDTAGVLTTGDGGAGAGDLADGIHHAAQQVAQRQADRADVKIECVDVTHYCGSQEPSRDRQGAAADHPNDTQTALLPHRTPGCCAGPLPYGRGSVSLVVFTKADLAKIADDAAPGLLVSSLTGRGLPALRAALRETIVRSQSAPDHAVASTAARCGESLRGAAQAIDRARRLAAEPAGEELVAAEIRAALEALGQVAGAVCTDDVLDRVFSRFCIGK